MLTSQAEGAEHKIRAIEDGEAAVLLLPNCLGTLEVLGVLPGPDLLDLHDVHCGERREADCK